MKNFDTSFVNYTSKHTISVKRTPYITTKKNIMGTKRALFFYVSHIYMVIFLVKLLETKRYPKKEYINNLLK